MNDDGWQLSERGEKARRNDSVQGLDLLMLEIIARCPSITMSNASALADQMIDLAGNVEDAILALRTAPADMPLFEKVLLDAKVA